MIKKWADEIEYQQRHLMRLMIELENLDWYDKDVWQLVFDTISHKKRINNIKFLDYFN